MVEGVVAVGVTGPFQQLVVPKRFLEDDGVVVVVVVVVAFMLEDLSRCRRSFAASGVGVELKRDLMFLNCSNLKGSAAGAASCCFLCLF